MKDRINLKTLIISEYLSIILIAILNFLLKNVSMGILYIILFIFLLILYGISFFGLPILTIVFLLASDVSKKSKIEGILLTIAAPIVLLILLIYLF